MTKPEMAKNVDAGRSAWNRQPCVERDHHQNRDRAQTLDVTPSQWTLIPGTGRNGRKDDK